MHYLRYLSCTYSFHTSASIFFSSATTDWLHFWHFRPIYLHFTCCSQSLISLHFHIIISSLKYTWPNLQLLIWFISESRTLPPSSRRNCDKLIWVLLLTLSRAYNECRAYPVGQHSDYLLQWMAGSQQQQSRLFVPKAGCSTMWPN